MTAIEIRQGPSGPPTTLSDTLSPPGTVLGAAIDAVGRSFAVPLEGDALGAIQRFAQYAAIDLPAGTQDNVPIPDGAAVFDVTPTGAVILPGVAMTARGNTGGFLLRKSGVTGTLSISSNTSSVPNNRFFTASASLYSLESESDAVRIFRFNTRWQAARRLLVAAGQSPSADGSPALTFSIRTTFTTTGAGADDITITLAIPVGAVIYDAICQISIAVGGSTAVVRSAAGGGGVALTSTFDTATTGTRRNNATSLSTVAMSSSLFLRRSSGNIAGTIIVFCKPAP